MRAVVMGARRGLCVCGVGAVVVLLDLASSVNHVPTSGSPPPPPPPPAAAAAAAAAGSTTLALRDRGLTLAMYVPGLPADLFCCLFVQLSKTLAFVIAMEQV
eukprot:COSAG02_NODE_2388_length_8979_cov_6.381081_4_plen_102_part_00